MIEERAQLPRKLGLFDSTSIVIGTMVGSAIFLVPSSIAQNMPSAPLILVMWVVAGAAPLLGALAYAELGAMMPAPEAGFSWQGLWPAGRIPVRLVLLSRRARAASP
jgi:amino acid transporter